MSNIIFGPVPSRRFGMSLGIDLSPTIKQCNFDCLYCELEAAKTVSKQTEVVKVEDIVIDLKKSLENHKHIDVITFTANGEPTLYPHLEQLIEEVDKVKGDTKTLILSNGANIYKQQIQNILKKIDIVKLSLDCVSGKCFQKLDRMDKSVQCEKIVEGMIEFRKVYEKQLICECLFVKTLNDSDEEIELLKNALENIKPNRVDIGTIDRPPAYKVEPISYKKLLEIANKFENIPVTIAHRKKTINPENFNQEQIMALLNRRPLTQDDIENLFNQKSKEVLLELQKENKIQLVDNNSVKFYKII